MTAARCPAPLQRGDEIDHNAAETHQRSIEIGPGVNASGVGDSHGRTVVPVEPTEHRWHAESLDVAAGRKVPVVSTT